MTDTSEHAINELKEKYKRLMVCVERDALQAKLARANEMLERMGDAMSAIGQQCRNTGMYGPLNIRPGECTCSTCNVKVLLSQYAKYKSEGKT